jgi:pyruvate-formate lyase-activating enzyme
MGSCTFCSSWTIWKRIPFQEREVGGDEVEMMVRKFNAKHFVFQVITLTGSRRDIMLFCREIIKRN